MTASTTHACPYCELIFSYHNEVKDHIIHDHPEHAATITQVRLDDVKHTVPEARVAQVFPMADATRHTVRVKFDLKPGTPAKAGMYADVMIPEAPGRAHSGDALPVIPMAAVVWRGGLPMVYVMDPQVEARLNLLRLGEQVGDEVSVLTGLRGGERVLVSQ